MRKTIRAAGAALLLAALVVGIPVALAATIGNPFDSWSAIKAGDVSSQVVIDVLAAVVWLCWAQFTLATLIEGWAAVRQVTLPDHMPLVFSGGRQLARTLIIAAFMLGPTLGTAISPPAAHALAPHPAPPAVTAPATANTTVPTPVQAGSNGHHHGQHPTSPAPQAADRRAAGWAYTVQTGGPRTFWDLAVTYLGDGQRWHEIWLLNNGRQQADGTTMTNPALLRPGWTVTMPAHTAPPPSTADRAVVQAGDTLSGIAAEHHLPSWQPIWQSDAGRPEPDGAHFTDPNLIRPGWVLTIPQPAAANATRAASPQGAAPAGAPPASHRQPVSATPKTAPPAPAPPGGGPAATEGHRGADDPTTTHPTPETRDPQQGTAPQPTPAEPTPTAARAAHAAPAGSSSTADEVAMFGGSGVLLAGLSWLAVTGYRRRQFRFRRPGRAIPATPDDLVDLEKQLLAASMTGVPDVTWLNQAMRSLVHSMALGEDGRLPDLLAVRMTDDVLELVLASPHTRPPQPWRATPDGTRWTVHRSDELHFDPDEVVFHFAPYPTLSTIGHTADGDVWLVDLERIGALTVTGDRGRSLDLARALAAELAHNVWSEQLQISLVGFGEQMAALNPARLSYSRNLAALLDTVHARLQDAQAAGEDLGIDALDSRLQTTAGEVWAPHVVLIASEAAADRGTLDELLATLRGQQQRAALAIVLADDADTAPAGDWTAHLAADGSLQLPALGVTVQGRRVQADEAAALTRLMVECAATTDRPMPQARGGEPWDSYTDVTGAILPQLTIARDETLPAPSGPGDVPALRSVMTAATRSVLPQPAAIYVERAAVVEEDLDTLAPGISPAVRRRIEADNKSLDDDLVEWHSPDGVRPKLTLLGPVALTLPSHSDEDRTPLRLAMSIEIITYLSSRKYGATVDQLAAALWPDDRDIGEKTLPKGKISMTRGLLGRNPHTGRLHIPHGTGGVYTVEDVLIDAELCRRLHTRGTARGADGIPDLWHALELVTGVPLDQRRAGGYRWLLDVPLEREYLTMIIDISSKVVTHELAACDPVAAMRAAQIPMKAGASDDTVLLNIIRAHDAAGERAEGDAVAQQILANFDVEDEVDLPPRTAEILRRRQYG